MALFRRLFYRKPPDRLLEISERVYGRCICGIALLCALIWMHGSFLVFDGVNWCLFCELILMNHGVFFGSFFL